MKTNNIKAVLFDFDGTIMDTNEVIINSWQHTFRSLKGKEADVNMLLGTFGEPLEISIDKMLPEFSRDDAMRIYREYQYCNFKGLISLFPGVVEVLRELKEKDIKTAIVTSRLRRTTMEGIEKFDLHDFFDTVVTMEDTKKHKPDAEPAFEALRRLDIEAERAIMVGDSKFDIMCAQNAGVKSVLVDWSVAAQAESGIENKADFKIRSLKELLDFV